MSKSIKTGEVVDVQCESCNEVRGILKFRESKLLNSGLYSKGSLWGHDRRSPSLSRNENLIHTLHTALLNLRSAPPPTVPEGNWTLYRTRLREAFQHLEVVNESHAFSYAEMSSSDALSAHEDVKKIALLIIAAEAEAGTEAPVPPRAYFEVNASMEKIREYVKSAYEPQVWFGGLQAFSLVARERAHAFSTKKFVMSTYSMAGRAMQTLTLLPSKHEITLITAEDESEPRMGISSIFATEDSALKLLKLATEAWQAGTIKLKVDRGVSLG